MAARRPHLLPSFLAHVARGFVIGSADLVPGVSGGTMALILGIYRRLVTALGAVTKLRFRRRLAQGRIRGALAVVDAGFLAALGVGIGLALLLLSKLFAYLLANHLVEVYAAFFGLIAASVVLVGRRVPHWSAAAIAAFVAGTAGAFVLVGLSPTTTPDTPWFLVLSGAIAVCALILPGISGSFILVLLGKYTWALEQLSSGNLVALLPVLGGAVVGILTFARILAWLLERYPAVTLALLSGFLLGSLRKVWPWQETLGTLTVNVAPPPGFGGVGLALALALAGAILVLLLDRLGTDV